MVVKCEAHVGRPDIIGEGNTALHGMSLQTKAKGVSPMQIESERLFRRESAN